MCYFITSQNTQHILVQCSGGFDINNDVSFITESSRATYICNEQIETLQGISGTSDRFSSSSPFSEQERPFHTFYDFVKTLVNS